MQTSINLLEPAEPLLLRLCRSFWPSAGAEAGAGGKSREAPRSCEGVRRCGVVP